MLELNRVNEVLRKMQICKLDDENTSGLVLTQCQKTMSPGLTFGTEVIVSSSRRCGCVSGVGRGPTYPP